ncbi:glycosyltransferase family 9 protein [Planctomycetota bacterium]
MIGYHETDQNQPSITVDRPDQCLTVQRCHGLGNIICLLPVLDSLYENGCAINVITQSDWISAFSILRPDFTWSAAADSADNFETIDLDDLTRHSSPREHRTDEFGRLLAVDPPFPPPSLSVPESWTQPFEILRDAYVFAPEGGHPSRTWPTDQAALLKNQLADINSPAKLVLVGTDPEPVIPCDVDTRGQLQLPELIGILAVAGVVVTMDSAVLHIAAALRTPTVAIFGGVDHGYRIRPEQPVVVIQTQMPCCPCNKQETCAESFNCIRSVTPEDVDRAIQLAHMIDARIIYQLPNPTEESLSQIV